MVRNGLLDALHEGFGAHCPFGGEGVSYGVSDGLVLLHEHIGQGSAVFDSLFNELVHHLAVLAERVGEALEQVGLHGELSAYVLGLF